MIEQKHAGCVPDALTLSPEKAEESGMEGAARLQEYIRPVDAGVSAEAENPAVYCALPGGITDRKKIDQSLYLSEVRYRRLFEAAQDGILIVDAVSGVIMDANPFLLAMLGYASEEVVGRKLWEIGFFKDVQKSREMFLRLQAEGYIRYEDLPLERKDGSLFDVEFVSNVYQIGVEKVVQCNIRDITERKKMDDALRFLARCDGTFLAGESFFQALASFLAGSLGMDYICIDRLDGGLNARPLAVWCGSKSGEKVEYTVKDTFFGDVAGKEVSCFPSGACRSFPQDTVLKDLRAESYLGVTLWSYSGKPIGMIAVIGRKPLKNPLVAASILKLVALRVANELEREEIEENVRNVALFSEQNPAPVLRVGADGVLLYANPASQKLLRHWGIETKQAVPRSIAAAVESALKDGSSHETEVDLEDQQISFILSPVCASKYVNCYGRDVTEMNCARAREREAMAFASSAQTAVDVLEAMGEGVLLVDMEGRVVSANSALEKMTGIPASGIYGKPAGELFGKALSPEECRLVEIALTDAMAGQIPAMSAITMVHQNGRRIPVVPAISFVLGVSGRPAAIVITLRDFSSLYAAQKRQEISEQKYRELVENANSIIMRITPEHDITFFNEYAQKFFGYKPDEILGRNVLGTIVPEVDFEGNNLQEMLDKISAHPESHANNENENMCKNGRRVWVYWSNRAIRDEKGKLQEILCVGTDVTERKRAQQAIDAYQLELRALSSKLTLAEERARRQLAIALHDTVGQTMALTKIKLGSLGEIVKGKEPVKALAEIREMFDESVRQIRTLSFELSPPILYELGLEAAIEWLSEDFAKQHGVRTHFNGEMRNCIIPQPISILFFQSARELFANIVKHAAATEVCISIKTSGGQVYMKIKDNGRGMERNELAAAVNERKSLGLFSIRERMKHIGGTFEVQSSRGRGTTAILMAPL